MDQKLHYPPYVIANCDGVLVIDADGKDCILLFHSKELAELHIEQVIDMGAMTPLHALAVPDADALREGLESLPADITYAVCDATATPEAFVQVEIDELMESLA